MVRSPDVELFHELAVWHESVCVGTRYCEQFRPLRRRHGVPERSLHALLELVLRHHADVVLVTLPGYQR